MFKKIAEAYRVLSDENKRGSYDFEVGSEENDNTNQDESASDKTYDADKEPNWRSKRATGNYGEGDNFTFRDGNTFWGGGNSTFFKTQNYYPEEENKSLSPIITIIIMFALYYLVSNSNWIEKPTTEQPPYHYNPSILNNSNPNVKQESVYKGNKLENGASPYNIFFGGGIYDRNSYNRLMIKNEPDYDTIVCLVDVISKITIRNEYIRGGASFLMTKIPDGEYCVKCFSGKDWNPMKTLLNGKIRGAFDTSMGFSKFDKIVQMKQYYTYDGIQYTSTEITLYTVMSGNISKEQINDSEFFNE